MSDLKYTKEHEWVKLNGEEATVGITEYAQEALGDLVYVELPEVGAEFSKGDDAAVVESVKIASEVYSPLSGEITAVNDALSDDPESMKGPLEEGWIFKMKITDASELDDAMTKEQYESFLAEHDG